MLLCMRNEIPESFFADLDNVPPVRNVFGSEGRQGWTPAGAMKWYDHIIDDLLANPGTSLTDCAARLGRAPHTVQTIVRSDLFQARYAQRRQQFEAELDRKIVAKITKTAELALDATIEHLEKKRDTIPLPILNEVTKTALDRLGYGPSRDSGPQVNVQLNNNVVSAEALASAREKLKLVEGTAVPNREASPAAPVAGPARPDGEED